MELQALLTSNILLHIKKIIRAYFNSEDYLHVEYDENDEEFGYSIHYMMALTGDMLYVLNDYENFTYPGGLTSHSLEKRCPDLFTERSISRCMLVVTYQSLLSSCGNK